MSHILKPPTYETMQWTGDNAAECEAFHLQWFPQPPPPPEWMQPPPPPPFVLDEAAQTLSIYPGYTVELGGWLVNGGSWGPHSTWAGAPEAVTDVVFLEKYAPQPSPG